MTAMEAELAHPIVACAREVTALVQSVSHVDPLFMTASDKADALLTLAAGVEMVQALAMRVMAAADEMCEATGDRDVASFLAHRLRADRPAMAAQVRLARALDEWPMVAEALGSGAISTGQAAAIVRALGALPDDLDAEIVAAAQQRLLELAADLSPRHLRIVGRRILELVAPELAAEHEARELQRLEARAHDAMSLFIRRDADGIDGLSEIRIKVPDAVADRFRTYLEAFTNPRRDGARLASPPGSPLATPLGDRVPHSRRLAGAFCQLLESYDPERMPLHGGAATTVMVTVSLADLRRDLGAAGVIDADDSRLSAADVRRLACTADLVPVVLGERSEILDLGRSQRLFSRAQRRALALRDRGCRAEGCTIPATWCEAHHRQPWSTGGRTDVDDGLLLCSWHHHRVHDDRYLHRLMPNGDVRFSRRR